MTLVIAKKSKSGISLSSDSRLSLGESTFDYGVKIFAVPVKIYSPTKQETNRMTLDYDYKIGLAVAGSTLNAYIVKEFISETLQNLQYIPERTELSMDEIANLVFKVFKKITLEFCEVLHDRGVSSLILAGYCPKDKKIRLFKFGCNISGHPIKPFFEEILTDDGIEFLGSGECDAKKIYGNNNNLSPLKIINEVIKDNQKQKLENDEYQAKVGGYLQYGEFVANNFQVYGVTIEEECSNGLNIKNTLRGITLFTEDLAIKDNELHISYSFKKL